MENKKNFLGLKDKQAKPWMYTITLLVNILVFVCIVAVYVSSNRSYSEKLFDENIQNVETLNAASANAAYTYTSGMGVKIEDIISYIEARDLDYDETVRYLSAANTDPDRQLQLVLSGRYGDSGVLSFGSYSGISLRLSAGADGSLQTNVTEIRYGSGYYDIFRIFTDADDAGEAGVCFAPEFTDPDTKRKCFAAYRHTVLTDSDGNRALYTILLAINSETAQDAYDMHGKYDGQSSVLVNGDGNYIIKNNDYRNTNFFDYIANYNGLTLDRKAKIQQEVFERATIEGLPVNLFYKNHRGADCVFSVVAMQNGWYGVTCVPLSSFQLANEAVNYSLIILLLFVLLFAIDGFAIYFIGKAMRKNVAIAESATKAANEASQAKSRFLSTMSHELRTPLNAIIGLVSLSRDRLDDPPVLRDYLNKIDVSSKLLLQLISDILDVSAIESNKMRLNPGELEITKLLTSLSAIYYDQCAAKGIEFSVVLKNMHSETLIGDSVRVNQVLLNFLSNAVKFTPAGGRITLCAEQTEREASSVVIRFTVSDTGCGVSKEMRDRLFQPFERAAGETSRKYGGSGLGLSIAKNLTELMHGRVGMESTEGAGSTFWAEIPFDLPTEMQQRSFNPIENVRVLCAIRDDNERAYIGQILSGFGVERCLTDSAAAALELLRERSGGEKPFTVCILDWKMTDLRGPDAARRIRETANDRDLCILVLAYDVAKANAECSEAGVNLVLGKPVFPSALYNALTDISAESISAVPGPEQSYGLTGKRVLLVEDNKLNTEIAKLLLCKVGIDVECAENGRLGLERFLASAPGYFDAILMDIQMPVMDGYLATQAIRASAHPQAGSIPILAMTADAFTDDVEKARVAGMNEHIAKPVVPEALYAVLREHLRPGGKAGGATPPTRTGRNKLL